MSLFQSRCTLVTGFQNSPIQCTDRSTKRSSASAFFDMEFYKRQWPLTWIYYISVGLLGVIQGVIYKILVETSYVQYFHP